MYPQHPMASGQSWAYNHSMMDHGLYQMGEPYNPDHSGWVGVANADHYVSHQVADSSGFSGTVPATPDAQPSSSRGFGAYEGAESTAEDVEQEGAVYTSDSAQIPVSPYWGHLDHATLALMAIASPQGKSAPQTPSRRTEPVSSQTDHDGADEGRNGVSITAQPLLLRHQYYGYGVRLASYGSPSSHCDCQFFLTPPLWHRYSTENLKDTGLPRLQRSS
jgi:hypothetical protein